MITRSTWAITGAAAALILVPAGVSYAVISASDDAPPTTIERVQVREQIRDQVHYPAGDYARDQVRDQVRYRLHDQMQNPAGDYALDRDRDQVRDQARDQLRDRENCDGDGPIGDGPRAGDHAMHGGMMGGSGSGR